MPNKELENILLKRIDELQTEIDAIRTILDVENSNAVQLYLTKYYSKNLKDANDFKFQGSYQLKTSINNVGDIDFVYIDYLGNPVPIELEPKDKETTWKNYLIKVIESLGGRGKTSDIANAIILSNKDISFIKARQTASDLLPELVKDGKLRIEQGNSRKQGNLYTMKGFTLNKKRTDDSPF